MAFVKAKSKRNSDCSFEKDGMKCAEKITEGGDYIWDTEEKKAYCCKHDNINSKVTERSSSGGGFGSRSYGQSQRTPEDMLSINATFITTVLPNVIRSWHEHNLKNEGVTFYSWLKINQEIYMDKFDLNKNVQTTNKQD